MATLVHSPTVVRAAGNKPKEIQEYIGNVNTATDKLSIAHMKSPQGWVEPAQSPDFDEYTIVLAGTLCAKTYEEEFQVKAGQALIVNKGEWVKYSTPFEGGAEYIAVCSPAFSDHLVNRDRE